MSPETKLALQNHFNKLSNDMEKGQGIEKVTAYAASVEFGELLLILHDDYPEISRAVEDQMADFTTASILKFVFGGLDISIKRL